MNGEVLTQIILAIITIAGAVITYYVIPVLKAKAGEIRYKEITDFAYQTVRAAKQMFNDNVKKKEYVTSQIKAWLAARNISIFTDEQIEAIIEGVYNEIKEIGSNTF